MNINPMFRSGKILEVIYNNSKITTDNNIIIMICMHAVRIADRTLIIHFRFQDVLHASRGFKGGKGDSCG